MQADYVNGATFLIDKPVGWTSFDAVNYCRNTLKKLTGLKKIKIGHAGTLDPMASGLLIMCTGLFTKRIEEFQDLPKEYTGEFYIGKTTPSFDLETEPDKDYPVDHITEHLLKEAVKKFIGTTAQFPPMFSAKKVQGRRLYDYARSNQEIEVQSREITIYDFEITNFEMPFASFRITCTKGTYVRALARDFGEAIGSGSYLYSLCRTRIGEFDIKDAQAPDIWRASVDQ